MTIQAKSLNGFKYLVCVIGVVIFVWFLFVNSRLNRVEAELDKRSALLTEFLEIQTRVAQL